MKSFASLLISSLVFLAGCGSGSGGDGSGGDVTVPSGCTAITVDKLTPGRVAGWFEASVHSTDASDTTARTLRIELNEPHGAKIAPGDYDLSKEPDYAGAAHAVVVFAGGDDPTNADKVYFQASGTMHLDVATSPPSRATKGSLHGVKLVESTVDKDTYASAPVADGECLFVVSADWDTTVASGATCNTASDCGDTNARVCDPVSKTCVASQCDSDAACGSGKSCIVQAADSRAGACYPTCKPLGSDSACGDAECVVVQFDQSLGICKTRGTGKEGEACSIGDVSTGCAAGLVCSPEESGNVCRTQCDYFSGGACPGGQHCVVGSVCSDMPIDPAAVDAPCDGSSAEGTPCGLSGKALTAMCVTETGASGATVMCRKTCRSAVAADCPSGKACDDSSGSLGVCR